MADKTWREVCHLYIGCDVKYPDIDGRMKIARLSGVTEDGIETTYKRAKRERGSLIRGDAMSWKPNGYHNSDALHATPILRDFEDMTDEEQAELIILILGQGLEDPITPSEISIDTDPYPNRIGVYRSSVTLRCWDGFVDLHEGGGVLIEEEDGKVSMPLNAAEITHWYVSHGFDLFGLLKSGQAIKKKS